MRKRIIQDFDKVFEFIETVWKSEGIKIDGLGNRKGKCQEAPCQVTRGGKRSRENEKTKTWLHPDVLLQRKVNIEAAKIKKAPRR